MKSLQAAMPWKGDGVVGQGINRLLRRSSATTCAICSPAKVKGSLVEAGGPNESSLGRREGGRRDGERRCIEEEGRVQVGEGGPSVSCQPACALLETGQVCCQGRLRCTRVHGSRSGIPCCGGMTHSSFLSQHLVLSGLQDDQHHLPIPCS